MTQVSVKTKSKPRLVPLDEFILEAPIDVCIDVCIDMCVDMRIEKPDGCWCSTILVRSHTQQGIDELMLHL